MIALSGANENTKRTKFLLNGLRLVATVLFVALAVKAVRWSEMVEVIRHTSFLAAIVAALIYACLQCLSATRWWSIARASGMSLNWHDAVGEPSYPFTPLVSPLLADKESEGYHDRSETNCE